MLKAQPQASWTTGKPDTSDTPYTATPHMTGRVHWTHYSPTAPRANAKTLVFVHGACHNEAVWLIGQDNWVSYFTRLGYDVAALSLPGHKPSKGLVLFRTMEDYLLAMEVVANAVGGPLNRQVWVGHSMGGILVQFFLARQSDLGGVVVVDSPAPHRTLAVYLAFFRRFARRHLFVALRASLNTGAIFSSKALVRELLLGGDADDQVVADLRKHLGGETMRAIGEMRQMGRAPLALPGQKLLYLTAEQSAFFPSEIVEASANEYHAECQHVPGSHNIMMTKGGAKPAAEIIAGFIASLPVEEAPTAMSA